MTTEVIGKALYLELESSVRAGRISQLILLPSYLDNAGEQHPMMVMVRSLDEYSPRAQWDFRKIEGGVSPDWKDVSKSEQKTDWRGNPFYEPQFQITDTTVRSYWSDEEKEKVAIFNAMSEEDKAKHHRASLELDLIGVLFHKEEGTEIVKPKFMFRSSLTKPFAVEVTNDDMESAINYKTPQALIRRIQKVRVAKGLPEKVVTPA